MAVQLTYHGSPFVNNILDQGFKRGSMFSVAPGQVFSTTNRGFASTYGNPVGIATSKKAFSLPSFNFGSGVTGKEVIQSATQANKGLNLTKYAQTLKNSPTASKLLSGQTVSGFGGPVGPSIFRSAFSLPMTAAVSGPYALYQMNKPSTPAGYDYVKEYDKGSITSAADAENSLDYENFIKGMMEADKNYVAPNTTNINTLKPEDNLMTYDEHYNVAPDQDKGIFSKIKDFAGPIAKDVAGRSIASKALGGAGGMIFGPMGALVGGLAGLFGGGNLFNQPYRSGMNTVDEFGNLISAEDLDKQNALGGYYTDAARASRNRARTIQAFIARGGPKTAGGKKYFEKLKAQQAMEDKSRQNAFDEIMSQGNNQQDFYDSLNQGSGSTAVSGNPNTSGAGDAPGYSGPSPFKYGGIVGLYK